MNKFQRFEMLMGKDAVSVLKDKKVIVFGVGGVGGYVCEALCRSNKAYCKKGNGHINECRFLCHYFASLANLLGLTYMLIRGTVAFMIRIANEIPSGYAPNSRIRIVMIPIPAPKMIIPLSLIGEVT